MVRRRDRRRNKGCPVVQYHPRHARLSIISVMSTGTRRRAISDTIPRCGTMRRDPASDLSPSSFQNLCTAARSSLQRPVEIMAVQAGRRRIVGEIIALETRTRALPPTARAGYAAAVRRAR